MSEIAECYVCKNGGHYAKNYQEAKTGDKEKRPSFGIQNTYFAACISVSSSTGLLFLQ